MISDEIPSLAHLDRMTDSTGLIQHAVYGIPRRESGYTTDDNARALRLCARLCATHSDERMLDRVTCYLSFMEHAQCADGRFHNFMSYQREWLDQTGCGDSQGQSVLALAEVVVGNLPQGFRDPARELIDNALSALARLTDLRAHAYVVQAWATLWRANIRRIDEFETIARQAADHLVRAWHHSMHVDWQWFEPKMTYANAVLPHAMFDAAERWPTEEFLSIAESSFQFLDGATTKDKVFWPIGNNGWSAQNAEKAFFDQQPVEASTMGAAALTGLQLQHDDVYLSSFRRSHGWFQGQNSLQYQMADTESGGCFDGLEASGINRNQGAESTLAYLWTEVLAQSVEREAGTTRVGPSVRQQPLKLHE